MMMLHNQKIFFEITYCKLLNFSLRLIMSECTVYCIFEFNAKRLPCKECQPTFGTFVSPSPHSQ